MLLMKGLASSRRKQHIESETSVNHSTRLAAFPSPAAAASQSPFKSGLNHASAKDSAN